MDDLHSTDVCSVEKLPIKPAMCRTTFTPLETLTALRKKKERKNSPTGSFCQGWLSFHRASCESTFKAYHDTNTEFCLIPPRVPVIQRGGVLHCLTASLRNGLICVVSSPSGIQLEGVSWPFAILRVFFFPVCYTAMRSQHTFGPISGIFVTDKGQAGQVHHPSGICHHKV